MLGKTNSKPQPKYYKTIIVGTPLVFGQEKLVQFPAGLQAGTYVGQFYLNTNNCPEDVYNYSDIQGIPSSSKGSWYHTAMQDATECPVFTFDVTPAQAASGLNVYFKFGWSGLQGSITEAYCYVRRIS